MSKVAVDLRSSSASSHEPSQSTKPQAQSLPSADDTQSQSTSEELPTDEVNSQAQSQAQEIVRIWTHHLELVFKVRKMSLTQRIIF